MQKWGFPYLLAHEVFDAEFGAAQSDETTHDETNDDPKGNGQDIHLPPIIQGGHQHPQTVVHGEALSKKYVLI